eukprot:scaffold6974_cov20-Tisochrysis_lutea.AAC.1
MPWLLAEGPLAWQRSNLPLLARQRGRSKGLKLEPEPKQAAAYFPNGFFDQLRHVLIVSPGCRLLSFAVPIHVVQLVQTCAHFCMLTPACPIEFSMSRSLLPLGLAYIGFWPPARSQGYNVYNVRDLQPERSAD